MRVNTRWLLVTVAGIVPALIAGYFVAQSVSPDEVVETAVNIEVARPDRPEPTPVFPNLDLGPRPIGEWEWQNLRGGECVDPFDDPFAETFQVVSCDGEYEAVLTRVEVINTAVDAPYPGDDVIRQRAEQNCEEWNVSTLINADAYQDLLVVPSYSLGENSWSKGDRLAGCFIYRLEQGTLMGPLIGP